MVQLLVLYHEMSTSKRIAEVEFTGRLSRAAPRREGRAPSVPGAVEPALPALDSIPPDTIGLVGGQDGMRQAPQSLSEKSCPQPSGTQGIVAQTKTLAQGKHGR